MTSDEEWEILDQYTRWVEMIAKLNREIDHDRWVIHGKKYRKTSLKKPEFRAAYNAYHRAWQKQNRANLYR